MLDLIQDGASPPRKKRTKARPHYGPLHAAAPHHPKVYELMAALQCSHHEAFGIACCFWAQATDRLIDGCLPGKAAQLASLAMWTGVPETLAQAFITAGLIDVADDGRWYLHDWQQYGGASVAAVAERVGRFGGATGARGSEAKKKGACVEVTAAAAAAASNLLSSPFSSASASAGSDAGAEALQAAGPPPTPFDEDPYLAAAELLERQAAPGQFPGEPGVSVGELLAEEYPAFDGCGGRRALRDVVMLFLDHEDTKYPSKRARSFPVLLLRLRRWCEGDYETTLALWRAERGAERCADDRERRRTGEAQPAPTGNRGIEQTRALLQQQRELEHAADDATAAEGLAAMRLANQRGAGAAA